MSYYLLSFDSISQRMVFTAKIVYVIIMFSANTDASNINHGKVNKSVSFRTTVYTVYIEHYYI